MLFSMPVRLLLWSVLNTTISWICPFKESEGLNISVPITKSVADVTLAELLGVAVVTPSLLNEPVDVPLLCVTEYKCWFVSVVDIPPENPEPSI